MVDPYELERLSNLHKAGELTDEEFAAAKAQLLGHRPVQPRPQPQRPKPGAFFGWAFVAILVIGIIGYATEDKVHTPPAYVDMDQLARDSAANEENAFFLAMSPEQQDSVRQAWRRSAVNTPPPAGNYMLEYRDWQWSIEHGYVTAKGMVKNISGEKLEHVRAHVTFFDASGNMITSDDSFVDFMPLMPGQESPWKVMTPANPLMTDARLQFATLRGELIPSRLNPL